MSLIRRASRTFAVTVALVASASAAAAQNANLCTQLQARLITLERSENGGGSTETRAWDKAIAEQQKQIQRASSQARRFGCVSGFVLFKSQSGDPRCGSLMATIDRMRANLRRLTAARSQRVANPFAVARERSSILRAMQANRCGPNGTRTVDNSSGGGLFASLFGRPRYPDAGAPDMGFGTYRTICVRTCDGYYFPISFATVPSQFSSDAQTCQQMCPGAEVSLYSYRNPGSDVADAVSLAGEPYTSLPTAFLYRKEFVKSCSCGSVAASAPQFTEFDTAGSDAATEGATPTFVPQPKPHLRPAFGEDPETVANRAGDLSPLSAAAASDAPTTTTADGKQIRIVGPDYYYWQ